jgi:2-polyprenyl-3-methyl-5-hydroxy-6-metoxy-1,4-benzoquinol methylase
MKQDQPKEYYYKAYFDRGEFTHFFHRRKIDRIFSLITENSHVLDLGCGPGVLLHLLETRKACKVVGLDIRRDHVALARQICQSKGFAVGDVRDFQLRTAFDYVCCCDVIEHFEAEDLGRILERLGSHVKPGGHLVLAHPSWFYIRMVDPLWQKVKKALYPDTRFDDEVHQVVNGRFVVERASVQRLFLRKSGYCNLGLIKIWVFRKETPDEP